MVRRYVRGVSLLHGGAALPLPVFFLRWPRALRLLDTNRRLLDLYGWRQLPDRLALAVALVEASPAGAQQFLRLRRRRSSIGAWLGLCGVVLREAVVRSAQWSLAAIALLGSRWR